MSQLIAEQLSKFQLTKNDDSCRLFHGRGHCYEGLQFINIDWFTPVIWVVIYGEPDEDLCQGIQQQLVEFAQAQEAVEAVLWQQRQKGKAEQTLLYGQVPENCVATENGQQFLLNLTANQNIGFFLDAQPARKWLFDNAKNQRVLNLFAYTCSFSVAALAGGAQSVVNIDMAKSALATGQANHQKNDLPADAQQAKFFPHDIFRSIRKLEQAGPFDVVVIDPPSRQKGSFEADKDYAKLIRKLPAMLADEATIIACLNAPYLGADFLPDLFAENLPDSSYIKRLDQREDFPETDLERCLKMQIFSYKKSPQ